LIITHINVVSESISKTAHNIKIIEAIGIRIWGTPERLLAKRICDTENQIPQRPTKTMSQITALNLNKKTIRLSGNDIKKQSDR
jgi:hypothetical protein